MRYFLGLIFISTLSLYSSEKPNILWITSEDNGISWVGCYGSENAKTPAIDQLAKEGFRYTNCFDNATVCAPTRSLWITGMYPISNGTQPMRSRNLIPHKKIKYYADLLNKAGYFTSKPGKSDYNIGGRNDKACWDHKSGNPYGWRKRSKGQPFFAIVNITDSHESRAHGTLGKTKADPAKMKLYKYHPDLPKIRQNYAKYADAIGRMDSKVKAAINALKKDGLYEDTIIIYNSDHGGVMARSKRFCYSSGIHCPLVIRIPQKYKHLYPAEKPGMTVDRLVSFVDMPKTWLSLAGAEIPDTFQGTIFLGNNIEPEPKYHLAFRERADERLDCVRVMRGKRFAYHKNYYPFAPAGQHLAYLWKAEATAAWEAHHRAGKTDAVTGRFFKPRVSEEFYDNQNDFDNVLNLIDKPEHQGKISELKKALRQKQLELYDSGLLPEKMRERRASANNMTIYEMVRNKELYPLEKYLDAADTALRRDLGNLKELVAQLGNKDEGMRWWAVVGIHLIEKNLENAVPALNKALADDAHEVRIMAAWTLIKLGQKEPAMATLEKLLFGECNCVNLLHNVIEWMGKPAFPLVKKYIAQKGRGKSRYGISILGRIKELEGL